MLSPRLFLLFRSSTFLFSFFYIFAVLNNKSFTDNMSNSNTIQKEIQDFENLMEELKLISKYMTESLGPRISEITGSENDGNSIKNYVINHGIPVASTDELYTICSYEKPKDYILEKQNIDDIRVTVVVIAVVLSYEFYISIGVPLTECLKKWKPELMVINLESCMTQEDTGIFMGKPNNSLSLRNTFEKLKKNKDTIRILLQSVDLQQVQFEEVHDQDYIEFDELNDIVDSLFEDDYVLFKNTANKIINRMGVCSFLEICEPYTSPISQVLSIIGGENTDYEDDILDKFLSMNGISLDDISPQTPAFCRMMFNYNLITLKMIDNLPHKAKDALESFWSELDITWLEEPFKKWLQEEFQIIKKSVKKESKNQTDKGKLDLTEEKPKRHLSVGHDVEAIKKLATKLVDGYTNKRGSIPPLVSSNDEKNITINKLIFLFTGNKDYSFDGPYNLTWNAEQVYLKLLIKLLHNLNVLATGSHAVDKNRADYISEEYIKCSLTGGIWPKVAEAFENIKSGATIRNANYKKNYKDTEAPINKKRMNDMKVIADLWLKCKDNIDF